MGELTHASFFSGVGGLDLGLERAGWRTVSFSEIDPYASAVLAERWPGVPNLGDITRLVQLQGPDLRRSRGHAGGVRGQDGGDTWTAALWSGGFPCQDLSVAGKRRGLAGSRSGLAFAFLDLVGRHRPECVLLENVPGLLSSHAGRDLGTLLGTLGELGYGWAYRVLDAQWFGVPQRRRRVFILALDLGRHPDAHSAGAVLAVGTRCGRDHAAEREAWAAAAGRAGRGAGIVEQAISAKWSKQSSGPAGDEHHHLIVDRPPTDADRVRAPDGLAGRAHDRGGLAFVKGKRAQTDEDDESWRADHVSPTLNAFDVGDTRATTVVASTLDTKRGGPDDNEAQAGHLVIGHTGDNEALLPKGLDSNRYRAIGNGVAAPVAEWIGRRLAAYLAAITAERAA